LSADHDMTRIHRRVVQVGAIAAWLVAALFLILGFFTGQVSYYRDSLGPILAAGFMTCLILARRENAGVALLGCAVIIVVMTAVTGDQDFVVAAALALVIVAALGTIFVTRWQGTVIGVITVLLAIVPALWQVPAGGSLRLGVVMSLSFVITALILGAIRDAAAALNVKLRLMFEESPSAMIEEEWSRAVAYVRSEYSGRPERLRQFLVSYPEVVRRAVGLARIIRVNRAAIDLLEAAGPEDLLGSRNPEVLTDANFEAFVDTVVAHCQGEPFFEVEFPALTFRGRSIWVHARYVAHYDGSGSDSVLAALADVSSARAKEEALGDLVRAKDAFIASISHELRTPLTAVMGLASEMATGNVEDHEKAELMELVTGQAEEMSHIVDDLLVAARAEIGSVKLDLVDIDLAHELEVVIESVGTRLDSVPDSLPDVRADAARVRQILRNLLTNLDRYGGPHRRITGGAIGERAWLEVRDDGDGVPPDEADRIFEPYATAHSGLAGSVGLGLTVARQLAELMDGSIRYRRDGRESVFRLELPRATADLAINPT
jgi:signal transduction histidine kinase